MVLVLRILIIYYTLSTLYTSDNGMLTYITINVFFVECKKILS